MKEGRPVIDFPEELSTEPGEVGEARIQQGLLSWLQVLELLQKKNQLKIYKGGEITWIVRAPPLRKQVLTSMKSWS